MTGETLDLRTRHLILVFFVQCAGNIAKAHARLLKEGVREFGNEWEAPNYQLVYSYIHENPQFLEEVSSWSKDAYKPESYNRLESSTADAMAEYNQKTIDDLLNLQAQLMAAIESGDVKTAVFLRTNMGEFYTAFVEMNKVPNLFRDGYHPKQAALIDKSQTSRTEIKFGEERLPAETYEALDKFVRRITEGVSSGAPATNGQP